MKTSDFYYDLPEELIAQVPAEPRDSSRLLVYDRATGEVSHRIFRDIVDYLRPGDALVINQTRVLPVRLKGRKAESGAQIECLLLKRRNTNDWEALVRPAKRLHEDTRIEFGPDFSCKVLQKEEDGIAILHFFYDGVFENSL